MKNVTSIKSVKTESPKTPGGISKSLLTPCRRVGLSRNWKKAGPSPFVSPIAGSSTPTAPSKELVQTEKKVSRKRKERVESEDLDEEKQCTPETPISNDGTVDVDESDILVRSEDKGENLSSTPTRHIEVPRKKKSKTLLSAINKNILPKEPLIEKQIVANVEDGKDVEVEKDKQEEKEIPVTPLSKSRSKGAKSSSSKKSKEKLSNDFNKPSKDTDKSDTHPLELQETEHVVTPEQKSKSKGKSNISITKTNSEQPKINDIIEKENILQEKDKGTEEMETDLKPRSPNELTKECIVVIQKKIFKTDKKLKEKAKRQSFDSDSDDVPLGQLNKGTEDKLETPDKLIEMPEKKLEASIDKDVINLVDDEEDFIETKRPKVKKLADKATSIGGLKKKPKTNKQKAQPNKPTQPIQNSDFDDEDDFDFDNKKTILIRKSYEKVIKPQKAKSTGSITQKDIDELRARIEAKKKMLLARAMTEDTEELRTLIKKWQRGCQEALMELMELMKTKFADRPNMDYSEMLSMLKIPQTLVGYDAENDCFITPDDSTILLSKFNDS